MFSDEILRFNDGSVVRQDPESLELEIERGTATPVMERASHAATCSPSDALAWLRDAEAIGGENVSTAQRSAALTLAYGQRLADESVWLFRPDVVACVPSDGDRLLATQLEQRVRDLATITTAAEVDEIKKSARRRIVLAELRSAGLFAEPLLVRKAEVLDALGCPELAARARAAIALLQYYGSPERARFVSAPAPSAILDGVFSLDWPRSVTAPDGVDPLKLWCNCEDVFRKMEPRGTGTMSMTVGRYSVALHYRLEDGTRTVLHAASVARR
jgi:hypothetical protein